jgi:hypothetical protein
MLGVGWLKLKIKAKTVGMGMAVEECGPWAGMVLCWGDWEWEWEWECWALRCLWEWFGGGVGGGAEEMGLGFWRLA